MPWVIARGKVGHTENKAAQRQQEICFCYHLVGSISMVYACFPGWAMPPDAFEAGRKRTPARSGGLAPLAHEPAGLWIIPLSNSGV